MKRIVIIGTILILLILTAGCLDDLSSTLPPCCDGTCDGVKTSVIKMSETHVFDFNSRWLFYTVDSDGIIYGWNEGVTQHASEITPHYGHNITFSYERVNGHRHITGIIEDHDAKPKCKNFDHFEIDPSVYTDSSKWGNISYCMDGCECVQRCCGCEGK